MNKIIKIIEKEILNWLYVTGESHRSDDIEFCLGKREIGNIHSEGLTNIQFPMKSRDDLINSGVKPNHTLLQIKSDITVIPFVKN